MADQELVVLVTPVLVHPLEHDETPPLPGADVFEPSDVEFYLLGRLESRRPTDYRSPIRNNLARQARYRHCEDVFIIGPQGHTDGGH
jgi:pilus assembly protein CpaC